MRKSWWVALWAVAALYPAAAGPSDAFERDLGTLWEVLWHQSGTATRLVRWEQDIRVRIHGVHLAGHKAHQLRALRDAGNEAGIQVIDVSDAPDAARLANLSIEITPDSLLEANQPCVTSLSFTAETRIESAAVRMRSRDAWRCAYHEAMHVMGVRGHPGGRTVLSYFPARVDGLLPLDKVMLRGWYSQRMRGGMTPFEVLPILADTLVATLPEQTQARQARDRFFARTIADMQDFAEGKGDVPLILRRSGKTTDDGVRHGRMEMSFFLGVAYMEGATVAQDSTQAVHWLQRAAALGSRTAAQRLSGAAR